jgi:hypothetical protein
MYLHTYLFPHNFYRSTNQLIFGEEVGYFGKGDHSWEGFSPTYPVANPPNSQLQRQR